MRKILLAVLFFFCLTLRSHASTPVTLCFTGDIMLDRGVRLMMDTYGPDYPFSKVKDVLKSQNITFGNLECPLTYGGTQSSNGIILKGDPSDTKVLKESGLDILNIANNHIMDYGTKGYDDTIDALDGSHILHVDENPIVIQIQGIRIGYVGYTSIAYEGLDEDAVKNNIKKAKEHCDFLAVSFHAGMEYNHYPTEMQKKYSRLFIDYGADIVIGHHPHVLQGYETYKGKYIFYSLGNFVFDGQIQEGTDESIILNVKVDESGVKEIEVLPVKIINCHPRIVYGEEGRDIIQELESYTPSF